jgi:hypothetical protein
MANGMPSWEEWRNLSQDQREYSLYKVLSDLYHREKDRDNLCRERGAEIETLKKKKLWNNTVAAVVGAVTGVLTALGVRIGG